MIVIMVLFISDKVQRRFDRSFKELFVKAMQAEGIAIGYGLFFCSFAANISVTHAEYI